MHECYCFGGGRVIVWAGITHCGRTDLTFINGSLTGVRYRYEILSLLYNHSLQGMEISILSNRTMLGATWHVYAHNILDKITLTFFHGQLYHQIYHQFNIYGMNLINVFADVINHQSQSTSYEPP